MRNIKVSLRYAKSLISLSIKNKLLEKIKVDLDLIQSFHSNVEFKNLLKSPIVKNEKKINIFKLIFKDHISPFTLSFITLLIMKKRESFLFDVIDQFKLLYNDHKNILVVKLKTAHNISKETRSKFLDKIQYSFKNKFEIILDEKVDSSLIGGFTLNIFDMEYNSSVKNQLESLKKKINTKTYIKQF